MRNKERLYVATSLPDALAALADRGAAGSPLAGATWIMRTPLRREAWKFSYVAISKVQELRQVAIFDREITVGASVTNAELATALAPLDECRALATAAGSSANPAIRQVSTIGGNLCAADFPAADLVPALICLDAEIELKALDGTERIGIDRFLQVRSSMSHDCLVQSVIIPRTARRSAHVRLPLREAGDYAVAIVSIGATVDISGVVRDARVAVGSVEPVPRRWPGLEADLIGRPLDPRFAAGKAESLCGDFHGRDGIEAPGWYRVKVLPHLVRRAVLAVQNQL